MQNLPYVGDVFTGYDEYPKYPVETFFEKNGDCEDTSYLAASIIDAMNRGVALVLLPRHMAIAVWMDCDTPGTYYKFNGRCYYYVETTSESWAGEIPDEYYDTLAVLIEVPSGKTSQVYPSHKKSCKPSSTFLSYYTDGSNFYGDAKCIHLVSCLPYSGYYFDVNSENLYHDSGCSQLVIEGCYKSTDYPGYFFDSFGFYYDSRCTQEARICRPSAIYSGEYWDGNYSYWDSACTQKVISWCTKSTYQLGYFFNSLDYEYYYDYQCTQKADL